jgi:exodeoxyribonuclease VII small subunit
MTDADTGDARPPALQYEAARDELIDVVKRLENGGLTLEESITLWERGEELADICQRWLDGAHARLEAVIKDRSAGEDDGEG